MNGAELNYRTEAGQILIADSKEIKLEVDIIAFQNWLVRIAHPSAGLKFESLASELSEKEVISLAIEFENRKASQYHYKKLSDLMPGDKFRYVDDLPDTVRVITDRCNSKLTVIKI